MCREFNVALFSHRFTGDFVFNFRFPAGFDAPTIELFKNKKDKEGIERLCSLRLHPVEPFKV